jgi:hypothetical protein
MEAKIDNTELATVPFDLGLGNAKALYQIHGMGDVVGAVMSETVGDERGDERLADCRRRLDVGMVRLVQDLDDTIDQFVLVRPGDDSVLLGDLHQLRERPHELLP